MPLREDTKQYPAVYLADTTFGKVEAARHIFQAITQQFQFVGLNNQFVSTDLTEAEVKAVYEGAADARMACSKLMDTLTDIANAHGGDGPKDPDDEQEDLDDWSERVCERANVLGVLGDGSEWTIEQADKLVKEAGDAKKKGLNDDAVKTILELAKERPE